jgi:hypothetical protein
VRIYRSQVPRLAEEIVTTLMGEDDIEVVPDNVTETVQDVRAIMDEHGRQEAKIVREVRDYMHERQITYDQFGKIKGQLCEEHNHPTGDDGVRWIIGQIIESFLMSNHVEEVYAEDFLMRRKMMLIFRRILIDEADLDREARTKIRNVREGTAEWEFEYKKALDDIRKKRGLDE